ncbi:MAG: MFS transporter [bacterium]
MKLFFRAFHYRNYRLFFSGQSISLIGTWMQRIALSWLVYRLTHSPILLGITGFSSQFPTFMFAPFAGVFADHWNRHRILVITQILAMVQALILATLVLTNTITVPYIIILSITLAVINGFDIPARQSFIIEMVENKNDLGNAIALNSATFNSARLIGPSIAGVLIAVVGEGICFLINGISYIAVIIALLLMRLKPRQKVTTKKHVLHELKLGLIYAVKSEKIRSILLLLALVSLVGMPYAILMPIFAQDVLHGGPSTLGFLVGAAGIGALIGAGLFASRKNAKGLEKAIPLATSTFGLGLIVFSYSRILWLSMIFMVITGFGMMVQMISSNTLLQTIVDDDKRGRVMSFYAMSFMGMAPIGSLLGGWAAKLIGAPNTLLFGGIICIIGAIFFIYKLRLLKAITHSIGKVVGINYPGDIPGF